jgi:hypothetical protein
MSSQDARIPLLDSEGSVPVTAEVTDISMRAVKSY